MQSTTNALGGNQEVVQRKAERIGFLDFARGFAILTIVVYHFLMHWAQARGGLWPKAIMVGGSGVHLFIIMSGFGLYLSISAFSTGSFFRRRFVKVLLPYYLIITVIFLVNFIYTLYLGCGLYAYLGHIFWYKMFDESIVASFGAQFWFLSMIVQFYLVFPLLWYAQKRLNNNFVFVMLATLVSVIYWIVVAKSGVASLRIYNSSFLQFLWEFCLAMALADAFKRRNYRFWEQKPLTLGAVAVGGMGLMAVLALKGGDMGRVFNDIPAALGYTAVAAIAYLLFKKVGMLLVRFFNYLGGISYELFLVHIFVADIYLRVVFGSTSNVFALLSAIPLAIAGAHLYRMLCTRLFRIGAPIRATAAATR
jgi:peptidoglycan/LPS O-acetylase OafA/YrhL